jgi:hypothetical protein
VPPLPARCGSVQQPTPVAAGALECHAQIVEHEWYL